MMNKGWANNNKNTVLTREKGVYVEPPKKKKKNNNQSIILKSKWKYKPD